MPLPLALIKIVIAIFIPLTGLFYTVSCLQLLIWAVRWLSDQLVHHLWILARIALLSAVAGSVLWFFLDSFGLLDLDPIKLWPSDSMQFATEWALQALNSSSSLFQTSL